MRADLIIQRHACTAIKMECTVFQDLRNPLYASDVFTLHPQRYPFNRFGSSFTIVTSVLWGPPRPNPTQTAAGY